MYAEERQRVIVESARTEGRVEVGSLASEFGVTPETVRRDLTSLERQGVLRRTHGGAVPVERLLFEREVSERLGRMVEEKERIARAALEYVPQRGTVVMDAGTTTGALAAMLPDDRELTVVTNCLPVAGILADNPSVSLIFAGGRVRGRTLSAVGEETLGSLARLTVDVVFLAANGITLEKGLTTPDVDEASVKRGMISAGRQVVLMADNSKFGEEHFISFAGVEDVDVIVTDTGLRKDDASRYEEAGAKVVRV